LYNILQCITDEVRNTISLKYEFKFAGIAQLHISVCIMKPTNFY